MLGCILQMVLHFFHLLHHLTSLYVIQAQPGGDGTQNHNNQDNRRNNLTVFLPEGRNIVYINRIIREIFAADLKFLQHIRIQTPDIKSTILKIHILHLTVAANHFDRRFHNFRRRFFYRKAISAQYVFTNPVVFQKVQNRNLRIKGYKIYRFFIGVLSAFRILVHAVINQNGILRHAHNLFAQLFLCQL